MITQDAFAVRHPYYSTKQDEWSKWRDTMNTGNEYIQKYLQKYSERESTPDFEARKKYAPVAAFAKSCLFEIRNSIFKQLSSVERRGGSKDFQECMSGNNDGVDLHGNSMNQFIGIELLTELLSMSRVGIFVDMPSTRSGTLADDKSKRPYYYMYRVEDILSWTYRPGSPDEFSNLLLRDYTEITDSDFHLPCGVVERIRHIWIDTDGLVKVEWWISESNTEGQPPNLMRQDYYGNPITEPIVLDIERIPFVMLAISDSLLADVANYQIALMNLNSSDLGFLNKANIPVYTEQRDDRSGSNYLKKGAKVNADGTAAAAGANGDSEIKVGGNAGRFYDFGMERPGFINPSPEPIQASMAKQDQLKNDIRTIMNLSLSNVKAKMASEGSKTIDNQGLESGLAAIGLVLERGERKCAVYWQMYENNPKEERVFIKYPEKYSLISDEDRRKNAEAWADIRNKVPSVTFAKWISKQIAREMMGPSLTQDELEKIYKELDDSEIILSDPEILLLLVEAGVLDKVRCARTLGIPKESVKDAAAEHLERLKQIQETQMPLMGGEPVNPAARGLNDLAPDKSGGKAEKKQASDQTNNGRPERTGRGAGRNNKPKAE